MNNILETLAWVKLKKDFLVVKETLTRIGIAAKTEKRLIQSCHILHKQDRYAIVHFKELFALDGKKNDFDENDLARRNTIVNLLTEWGLVEPENANQVSEPVAPLSQIKILSAKDKENWELVTKYSIGRKV